MTHFDIFHALVKIQSTQYYELYLKQPNSVIYTEITNFEQLKTKFQRPLIRKQKHLDKLFNGPIPYHPLLGCNLGPSFLDILFVGVFWRTLSITSEVLFWSTLFMRPSCHTKAYFFEERLVTPELRLAFYQTCFQSSITSCNKQILPDENREK